MFRKSILSVALALGSVAALAPSAANAQHTTIVRVAPPPPRHEVVPAPREGFVWAPGHYQWRHGQYVWLDGHWMRDRRGYAYNEPHWVQRPNGEWVFIGERWERRHDRYADRRGPNGDRDRDGVSNRNDRDRDGDGVPNHRDNYPNNPNRS